MLQRWLVVLLLLSMIPAFSQPTQAIEWGDKSSPFGMVVSLGNRVRSDEMDEMISLMQEAGVQWNREEISWDYIQFEPGGPFRWDGTADGFYNYDRAIALQRDAGIQVLGLLDYNPAWFKSKNPHPDEWIKDWGDYVYAVVSRYGRDRGQIKHWEIWNEPNLVESGYESGLYTVKDYVNILTVANAAAKAADPEAKIVLGGIAEIWSDVPTHAYDLRDYLSQVAALGGWDDFDILGLHPYRPLAPEIPAWRRDHWETLKDQMNLTDQLINELGPKPIWYTEMGWSSEADGGVSELDQAAWMQRFYLIALTHPGIEKIFWYDFRNDTGGNQHYTRPINDPNEVQFHYGLLRRFYPLRVDDQRLRKPAFSAFYHLTHSLKDLGWQATLNDPFDDDKLAWQRWSGGERTIDVLWWTDPSTIPPYVTFDCACSRARVRAFDGTVFRVLQSSDGMLQIEPPRDGSPVWIERGGYHQTGYGFHEVPHTLHGSFRAFWEQNGGLARFGLPITDEIIEPGPGRIPMIVQYFERNRFEWHPRNPDPHKVLLGLLGEQTLRAQGVDWRSLPPASKDQPGCTYYEQTGHGLCWPFKEYWEQNGGLKLYGYPLTEAFWEYDPEIGAGRLVQYFERNRFEHHPEHAGTSYEVQLGLLGQKLYGGWVVWP